MSPHYKFRALFYFLCITLALSSCDFLSSPSGQRTGHTDRREDDRSELKPGAKLLYKSPSKVSAFGRSDNGAYLALTSEDQLELFIFNPQTQTQQALSHHAPIRAFDFSPFHNRVLTASDDGTAKIKNLLTGAVSEFVHAAEVLQARFLNSGFEVVTGSKDGTMRITDWRTDQEEIIDYGKPVHFLDVSSDDQKIVLAAKNRLSLYNRESKELRDIKLQDESSLKSVQFFSDSQKILYFHEDDTKVYSYDIEQDQTKVVATHEKAVLSAFSSSDEASLIISSSRNGVVKITDYKNEDQTVLRMKSEVRELNLSSSGDFLVFVTKEEQGESLVWYSLKEDKTTKSNFNTKIDFLDASPNEDGAWLVLEDGRVIEFSR